MRVICPSCEKPREVSTANWRRRKGNLCKTCTAIIRNQRRAKHGLWQHPLYNRWCAMRHRLSSDYAKNQCYQGLDMDPAWHDFPTFFAWAQANGWRPELTIDRKDATRGYWPDNCQFIPLVDNVAKKRQPSAKKVSNGEKTWPSLKAAQRELGLTAQGIAYRCKTKTKGFKYV
jgi:hypothetical protein